MRITLIFILFTLPLIADPWGKDADLIPRAAIIECKPVRCKTPVLGTVAEALIAFHQNVLSTTDGPRSNFRPSSSQYMLEAIRKYGVFRGVPMGCDRLMRENPDPWLYRWTDDDLKGRVKLDPVP